jgi:hypothetical protein
MGNPRLGQPRAVAADPKRDREMLVLRQAGWSLARIGLAYGISRQRVCQILRRAEAGKPRDEPRTMRVP